jgi:hypothetical protein
MTGVFIFSRFCIFKSKAVPASELLGFGPFPPSGTLETKKHDVSETGLFPKRCVL